MGGVIGKSHGLFQNTDVCLDYALGRKLGNLSIYDLIWCNSGKYATCYRATRNSDGLEVAIKVLSKDHDLFKKERVEDEVASMKGLNHPNCIRLLNAYNNHDAIFLVEELASGGELLDRIKNQENFSEKHAASIIKQIFEGVSYLHSVGVCHRDLKPSNILCACADPESPEYERIKICDFGLAHKNVQAGFLRFPSRSNTMDTLCGSPMYMAPEIAEHVSRLKHKKWDPSDDQGSLEHKVVRYSNLVDIWSVGVILYVMMCGFQPFMNWTDLVRGRYSFNFAEWRNVTQETKDFISFVLIRDPAYRPTAAQCLTHTWITSHDDRSLDKLESTKALQAHGGKHSIKERVLSMLPSRRMTSPMSSRSGTPVKGRRIPAQCTPDSASNATTSTWRRPSAASGDSDDDSKRNSGGGFSFFNVQRSHSQDFLWLSGKKDKKIRNQRASVSPVARSRGERASVSPERGPDGESSSHQRPQSSISCSQGKQSGGASLSTSEVQAPAPGVMRAGRGATKSLDSGDMDIEKLQREMARQFVPQVWGGVSSEKRTKALPISKKPPSSARETPWSSFEDDIAEGPLSANGGIRAAVPRMVEHTRISSNVR